MPSFYEFFAGGGMARAGLGPGWRCLLANDFDEAKVAAYRANWGDGDMRHDDVATLTAMDLPGVADLAWASFPCQDLSLAGTGGGLHAARSGSFWPFWRLMQSLRDESRAPVLIALENVCGLLTSRGGRDFAALCDALAEGGYRMGALAVDAIHFTPQSRPRLFVVALRDDLPCPADLAGPAPEPTWTPDALRRAHALLSPQAEARWLWWRLPLPPTRNVSLADLVEDAPEGVRWRSDAETARLLELMAPLHRAKVAAAQRSGRRMVGTVFRRTRPDGQGGRVQRAEVRFDGVAGCLRTPAGGSSRQTLLIVEGERVRSRLLSPREAARLMGLPDEYRLPASAHDALHLLGDGVAAPAVRHLAAHLLEPLLAHGSAKAA